MRDGYLTSTTATRTYITEDTHTVRVVSLVTDDKYLFSDEMGMYADGPNWQEEWPHGSSGVGANFWMDWEYPVHVEVWEADGTRLIEQDGSFKLNGQYSRALDQKSFAVYAAASTATRTASTRRSSPTGSTRTTSPSCCAARARTTTAPACATP